MNKLLLSTLLTHALSQAEMITDKAIFGIPYVDISEQQMLEQLNKLAISSINLQKEEGFITHGEHPTAYYSGSGYCKIERLKHENDDSKATQIADDLDYNSELIGAIHEDSDSLRLTNAPLLKNHFTFLYEGYLLFGSTEHAYMGNGKYCASNLSVSIADERPLTLALTLDIVKSFKSLYKTDKNKNAHRFFYLTPKKLEGAQFVISYGNRTALDDRKLEDNDYMTNLQYLNADCWRNANLLQLKKTQNKPIHDNSDY